ncbi:MAG: Zn-dependent protease with chaperone function [Verrucomicrobia bacterium]|jgi:Zn-dependent protease with chaperone function|nr:Zn-dependent protease with chaperone function [Verrucomicrobiota bacterium]
MPELAPKNFFQRQEDARASSLRLIPLFFLALLGVVAAVYLVWSAFVFSLTGIVRYWRGAAPEGSAWYFQFWDADRAIIIALVVLVLLLFNSIRKTRQLREGGRAVARLLRATRVNPGTEEPDKRRLLNVVEEMSVASGVPVPDVYILEHEPSINAFVAGHSVDDMIVGVTGGAVKYLSRDELQGVIAHEYSHIFNGDMALKMSLMGWVHGLFAVTSLADWVMEGRNRQFERELNSEEGTYLSGSNIFVDIFITIGGFVLSFIGWHGAVFGRMIKAAVSRQREYLADAAAVQFTRYPDGLAGAFEKVHKWPDGAKVVCPHAEEASHMFFADAMQGDDFFLFLSTHPPMGERIHRVRNMMGRAIPLNEISTPSAAVPEVPKNAEAAARKTREASAPIRVERPPILQGTPADMPLPRASVPASQAMEHVGMPLTEHLVFAERLLATLPVELKDAAHHTDKAAALVFALLLSTEAVVQSRQLEFISKNHDEKLSMLVADLHTLLLGLPAHARVPLIELSLPALRGMSAGDHRKFDGLVRDLVNSDNELDVFEFALQHILRRHLGAHFQQRTAPQIRYHTLKAVSGDVSVLLSLLASAGRGGWREESFKKGVKSFNSTQVTFHLQPEERCSLNTLEAALNNIREAGPTVRRSILQACAEVVAADGVVHAAEGELLRAVADALDCPMPPLLITSESALAA